MSVRLTILFVINGTSVWEAIISRNCFRDFWNLVVDQTFSTDVFFPKMASWPGPGTGSGFVLLTKFAKFTMEQFLIVKFSFFSCYFCEPRKTYLKQPLMKWSLCLQQKPPSKREPGLSALAF